MQRTKATLLLGISMIAMISLIAPISAAGSTYVEKEKSVYYFKIHGTPNPQAGPTWGKYEITYKNLSPGDQIVTIDQDYTDPVLGPRSLSDTTLVHAGEVLTKPPVDAAIGTEVSFTLGVDFIDEVSEVIVIPPP